ncbi:PTS sugar transporter subunit IIA [Enterococcus songbeiensis]|uniref:PTS sugar transporter subunit IIA n=1 Tax=Enterococcus songbeiensis TaxID=2559927 RepID=UPI0010F6CC62|nr:PTS sugar transporter subunit IIA [Enterococcus songbeiensis]
MNEIKKLLPESHIQTVTSVKDWKEAVKIASQPLLDEGLIMPLYVNNMIASVAKNGPYMVLTDYFALMHAKAGEGVNQQSISLLVTEEETDLEGKPVKIFLILAAKDNQSHLNSLQDIMAVFMDNKKYQTILNGKKEQIVQLFQ